MAIKLEKNKWRCDFCNETFATNVLADAHRDTAHSVIYVPIFEDDLNRLLMFLYRKDDQLLTKTLVETIQKYAKRAARKK